MVFDILINFWWKYQVYKYINLIKKSTICVKVDENVKIDDKIKIDENVKIDEPVNFYKNLHLPHHLPMVDFSTSGLLDQKEILRNGKNTKEEWNEKDKNHN